MRPAPDSLPPFDPVPVTLRGPHIELQPIAPQHAAGLAAAAASAPDLFAFTYAPADRSEAGFRAYIERIPRLKKERLQWAIVLHRPGDVVGSTAFLELRRPHRALEIGATWLAKPVHGAGVNPEVKWLQLTYAFETLGALRVQFKTHPANQASRRALERLGAVYEGTLRHYVIERDGAPRDSLVYSILRSEWPAVRANLEARLAAH